MRAVLYRRSDLEIVGHVDLAGREAPDLLFLGEAVYLRRSESRPGTVVYVQASVARVEFAQLHAPPVCSDPPVVDIIEEPTQPGRRMPLADEDARTRWDS